MAKRGRRPGPIIDPANRRQQRCISLHPDVVELVSSRARAERRTFSNMVEIMIMEAKRE